MYRNNIFLILAFGLIFSSISCSLKIPSSLKSSVQGGSSGSGQDNSQTGNSSSVGSVPAVEKALPGLFTINNKGDKVRFARGNLYHIGNSANSGWDFEQNQYDFRMWGGCKAWLDNRSTTSPTNSAGIFYWTPKTDLSFDHTQKENIKKIKDDKKLYPSILGINSTESIIFANNGTIMGSDWSILSDKEWNYIKSERPNAKNKIYETEISMLDVDSGSSMVTFYGQIILPDDFKFPEGCSPEDDIIYATYKNYLSYYLNITDKAGRGDTPKKRQWKKMEDAGAVFFPVPGIHFMDTDYNNQHSWFDGTGYWLQCLRYDYITGDYTAASTAISIDTNYDAALCDPYLGMIRMVNRVK